MVDSLSGKLPEKATRWELVVLELAAAGKVFCGLCWFHNFGEFIEAELGQIEPHGPHKPPGCALPPRLVLVPRGPLLHLLALS